MNSPASYLRSYPVLRTIKSGRARCVTHSNLLDFGYISYWSPRIPILLKKEDKLDDAKVERQEQQTEKILAWTRSNWRCKGYIGRMCTPHIQQEIQAVNTDWLAEDLWKWLKERYTLQNTASKWATIVSMDDLSYANCKNMAEYR